MLVLWAYLVRTVFIIVVLGLVGGLASFLPSPAPTPIAFPLFVAAFGLVCTLFEVLLTMWDIASFAALIQFPNLVFSIAAFAILATKFQQVDCGNNVCFECLEPTSKNW